LTAKSEKAGPSFLKE